MHKRENNQRGLIKGLSLILFFLFLFPAHALLQEKKGVEELIRDLQADKPLVRRAAAEQLGKSNTRGNSQAPGYKRSRRNIVPAALYFAYFNEPTRMLNCTAFCPQHEYDVDNSTPLYYTWTSNTESSNSSVLG